MKKVQITQSYKDMQLNRQVTTGEVLTVTDERADQLLSVNVGVIIETLTEEEANAPKAEGDLTPPLQAPSSSIESGNQTNEVNTEDGNSNGGSEENGNPDGVQAESGSEAGVPDGSSPDGTGETGTEGNLQTGGEKIDPATLGEGDFIKLGVSEEEFNAMTLEDQLGILKEAGIELPKQDEEEIEIEDLGNGDKPTEPKVKAPKTTGTPSPAAKKAKK